MHTLADCIKTLQGMTSSARNISGSTRPPANHRGNKSPCTCTTRPIQGRYMQRVPRVQTPNLQRVTRVQMPPSVPATHTDDTKRITCSMLAQTSVPRVHSKVTTTNMPTDSAKQECIRKRRAARLRNAVTPPSTSPRAQTRAQVATAAARAAPLAMSTRSRVQSNAPPPSRQPGFAVAVMRQQRHQRGMVRLS
jgi:hypothetical protein